MPRLSITLTESQSAALEAIAAETGATKQSLIGLAITSWIRSNEQLLATGTAPEPYTASQELTDPLDEDWQDVTEHEYVVSREGVEVAWLRGRLEHHQGSDRIITTANRFSASGELHELSRPMEYAIQPEDAVHMVGED